MGRTILHVDLDAFFASVEQRDRPELRGRPVVVGAAPDARGVVAAASYEARVFGIHSAMPSREAGRRCPDAVFVPPDMPRYVAASRQVFAIFDRFSPHVEPLSIDEAFLDVSGAHALFGTGAEIAERIRAAIRGEVGLTASVGVAGNKFLAKLASEMNKPDGVTVVPRDAEAIRRFLAPLQVERMWGVGPVAARALHRAGFRRFADLQACRPSDLARCVGEASAVALVRLAHGLDARSVEGPASAKSISREHTFDVDCADPATWNRLLNDLAEDVGRRLRAAGRRAAMAWIRVRWSDFSTVSRRCRLTPPCCDDFRLRETAHALLARLAPRRPVRLLGFGVGDLVPGDGAELPLLFELPVPPGVARRERLSRVVDRIREAHGKAAIRRGDGTVGDGARDPSGGSQRGQEKK